jgi:hypothetical protein
MSIRPPRPSMCASLLADAAHWRARAHAARMIAKDMPPQMATKRRMKEIAAEFDEFAQQAEQRAAGMQAGSGQVP